jgi:DNA-binding MurR/RpiR family transcriptional regulator
MLDRLALERSVRILAGASTIALVGARRAFPIAAYLAYSLRQLRLRCELIDQVGGMAEEQVELLGAGDALLAVSFAPYAPTTVRLATQASAAGVAVVAITDTPTSPLVRPATVWLEVAEADHTGFRSMAGSFAVATTLAVGAATIRVAIRREGERNSSGQ